MSNTVFKVAYLFSEHSEESELIETRFRKKLNTLLPEGFGFLFDFYTAEGSFNHILEDDVSQIINQEYDLIVTCGRRSTFIAKNKSKMPIIFTAIADSVKEGCKAN